MKFIEDIINNNSLSAKKKQQIIEDKWIENISDQIENNESFMLKYKGKIQVVIFRAFETIKLLEKDLNRRFKN